MKLGFNLTKDRLRFGFCTWVLGMLTARLIWVSKYPLVTLAVMALALASMFEFTVEREP